MVEIITHLAFYAGWPNAWAVFPIVREVYGSERQSCLNPLFGLGSPNDKFAKYFKGNSYLNVPSFPEEPLSAPPTDLPEPAAEWFRFYAIKRGHHPAARGGFTTTSDMAMMNFRLLDYIDEISPRPILFVVGDRAHSKFFSEEAYEKALEPKELYVVKDAEHIDLYDRTDRIPFDKITDFFKKAFN